MNGLVRTLLCTLTLMAFAVNTQAMPITDTVVFGSTEVAQIDLFAGLSWNEVNAACPDSMCTGELNGFDMAGWSWASDLELAELFNGLIGEDVFPFLADYREDGARADNTAARIRGTGLRPTSDAPAFEIYVGIISQLDGDEVMGGAMFISNALNRVEFRLSSNLGVDIDRDATVLPGFWFVRGPAATVPAPAPIAMIGACLLLFFGSRAQR